VPRPHRTKLAMALAVGLAAAACGGGSSPTSPSAPAPAPTAAPVARYRVVFDSTWSAATHPTDFPGNPHLSPLIGGTHAAAVQFWNEGGTASDGIEAMAELGRTTPLDQHVDAAVAARTAEHLLRGQGIARSPGSTSLEFEVSREYPLVTLVSMIAPSPDWFAGVHGLNLIQSGDWVREHVVPLYPYDAGTDLGASYESPDRDAQPRLAIRAVNGFPFDVQGRVAPIGSFTFTRLQ